MRDAAILDALGDVHLLNSDVFAKQKSAVDAAIGSRGELVEVREHAGLEEALREELQHTEGRLDVVLSALAELT